MEKEEEYEEKAKEYKERNACLRWSLGDTREEWQGDSIIQLQDVLDRLLVQDGSLS